VQQSDLFSLDLHHVASAKQSSYFPHTKEPGKYDDFRNNFWPRELDVNHMAHCCPIQQSTFV